MRSTQILLSVLLLAFGLSVSRGFASTSARADEDVLAREPCTFALDLTRVLFGRLSDDESRDEFFRTVEDVLRGDELTKLVVDSYAKLPPDTQAKIVAEDALPLSERRKLFGETLYHRVVRTAVRRFLRLDPRPSLESVSLLAFDLQDLKLRDARVTELMAEYLINSFEAPRDELTYKVESQFYRIATYLLDREVELSPATIEILARRPEVLYLRRSPWMVTSQLVEQVKVPTPSADRIWAAALGVPDSRLTDLILDYLRKRKNKGAPIPPVQSYLNEPNVLESALTNFPSLVARALAARATSGPFGKNLRQYRLNKNPNVVRHVFESSDLFAKNYVLIQLRRAAEINPAEVLEETRDVLADAAARLGEAPVQTLADVGHLELFVRALVATETFRPGGVVAAERLVSKFATWVRGFGFATYPYQVRAEFLHYLVQSSRHLRLSDEIVTTVAHLLSHPYVDDLKVRLELFSGHLDNPAVRDRLLWIMQRQSEFQRNLASARFHLSDLDTAFGYIERLTDLDDGRREILRSTLENSALRRYLLQKYPGVLERGALPLDQTLLTEILTTILEAPRGADDLLATDSTATVRRALREGLAPLTQRAAEEEINAGGPQIWPEPKVATGVPELDGALRSANETLRNLFANALADQRKVTPLRSSAITPAGLPIARGAGPRAPVIQLSAADSEMRERIRATFGSSVVEIVRSAQTPQGTLAIARALVEQLELENSVEGCDSDFI